MKLPWVVSLSVVTCELENKIFTWTKIKKLHLPNRNVTQPWAEKLQNVNIWLHQKLLALTWLHMIFSITIIIYYCIEDHVFWVDMSEL